MNAEGWEVWCTYAKTRSERVQDRKDVGKYGRVH